MSSMLGSHHPLVGRPASRDSRGESREERNTSGEDNDAKVRERARRFLIFILLSVFA